MHSHQSLSGDRMVLSRIDAVVQSKWFIAAIVVWLGVTLGIWPAVQHQAVQSIFHLRPVMTGWTATSVTREGDDVLISGHVVKRWQCDYRPPPVAETVAGRPLATETNSLMSSREWPADGYPRNFGPWRIKNGAGQKIRLYYHHVCFGADVLTPLGVIDATKL
jgi:hypothetical protein